MTRSATDWALSLAPVFWGCAFVGAVKLGHWIYLSGAGTARFAIGLELVCIVIGALLSLGQIGLFVRYVMRKDWLLAGVSVVSAILWFILIVAGVQLGAAIVYAT